MQPSVEEIRRAFTNVKIHTSVAELDFYTHLGFTVIWCIFGAAHNSSQSWQSAV